MPCCGQKRSVLLAESALRTTGSALSVGAPVPGARPIDSHAADAPPGRPHTVALRYTETSHILVAGPRTGARYEFSAAWPVQSVDSGDAAVLLATRYFVRA